tara:strand:- start:1195 stop:1962 length:768 start_codon:yes stop_codon:yes gene_type:complete
MYRGIRVLAVIPARITSARLPRKLLLAESGTPLIGHTLNAVQQMNVFDRIVVATDDSEIAEAVNQHGGTAIMTGVHASGTDRIVESLSHIEGNFDVVVNVQGDEPDITEEPVLAMLERLVASPEAVMSTSATRFASREELLDPACVKVTISCEGTALYFSRSVIPSLEYYDLSRSDLSVGPWARHIGIYAYRMDFIRRWHSLPESRLQQIESLEQLRPLEAGEQIQVATVSHHPPGIDTRADYDAFLGRLTGQKR